jgi:hypothetical protein
MLIASLEERLDFDKENKVYYRPQKVVILLNVKSNRRSGTVWQKRIAIFANHDKRIAIYIAMEYYF